jgi:hypothetical protein
MEKGMKRMVVWRGKDDYGKEVEWLDGYQEIKRSESISSQEWKIQWKKGGKKEGVVQEKKRWDGK